MWKNKQPPLDQVTNKMVVEGPPSRHSVNAILLAAPPSLFNQPKRKLSYLPMNNVQLLAIAVDTQKMRLNRSQTRGHQFLILWGHHDMFFHTKGIGHFPQKGSVPVNVVKALVSQNVFREILCPQNCLLFIQNDDSFHYSMTENS